MKYKMENKLLTLKEQFCKWYCPNKQQENKPCKTPNKNCNECPSTELIICQGRECEICMMDNFIKFIRDEL